MRTARLPLAGIRVLELAGLAPSPFAGLILADFGAEVIVCDRCSDGEVLSPASGGAPSLRRGKRSIALDLKHPAGADAFRELARASDVLIEPFRPGVMERLGLGPDELCAASPRLVYARLTGWGRDGDPAVDAAAGHDLNYLALSGVLSTFGRDGAPPTAPTNLVGDFAGGSLSCAFGIMMALYDRERSGRGQVVDAAMVDGASYLNTFVHTAMNNGWWQNGTSPTDAGSNILDGAAPFYDCYTCADGRHVAVGAIEPKFWRCLIEGIPNALLDAARRAELLEQHMDQESWPRTRETLRVIFAARPRDEWAALFRGTDACVTPVLSLREAHADPHAVARRSFAPAPTGGDDVVPAPAPRLSATPARDPAGVAAPRFAGAATAAVLEECAGIDADAFAELVEAGVCAPTPGEAKL